MEAVLGFSFCGVYESTFVGLSRKKLREMDENERTKHIFAGYNCC